MERVDFWKPKFSDSLEKHLAAMKELDPSLNIQSATEDWLIEKLAVLMVGSEELGKRVRTLEKQVDEKST